MSSSKQAFIIFILGLVMLVTCIVTFAVLLFAPSLEGSPTQRLLISSASLGPPSVYFLNYRSILPRASIDNGTARSNAITTYWFCSALGLLGAALCIEDLPTILVSIVVLIFLVFRLLTWKRRLISTLTMALMPTPAIRLILTKLGIEFELPDVTDSGPLAIAALIAFLFVAREK